MKTIIPAKRRINPYTVAKFVLYGVFAIAYVWLSVEAEMFMVDDAPNQDLFYNVLEFGAILLTAINIIIAVLLTLAGLYWTVCGAGYVIEWFDRKEKEFRKVEDD